jgi:hypothetical protein
MWRVLRITVLLLVLAVVAGQAWLDRHATTSWQRTVFVGAFPVSADGSAVSLSYIQQLDPAAIDGVTRFISAEAHRYGIALEEPLNLRLYPPLSEAPPVLAPQASVLARLAWSLKLRYYRWRMLSGLKRAKPQIALFLVYHDPALASALPHSAGLQRGLSGVVHLFATRSQEAQNRIVIAHELLHTFGATDKYDPDTGLPLYPEGYADPEQSPRYPQLRAELMAGRLPLSASESAMPDGLDAVRIGPLSAREIGWVKP